MQDLYNAVTQRIIAALEAKAPPWVRPWSTIPEAIPMNARTRRPYRGVNFTLLSLEAAERRYDVNRWLTYRQALELGAHVQHGQRGTTVVFWQLRRVGAAADAFPESDAPLVTDKVYPLLRAYTVFNVAQIDGLPASFTEFAKAAWETEARAEELLLMSEAQIRHGGAKAFYRPSTDEIQMPARAAFGSAAAYYSVALHELVHWTGHEKRCNRSLDGRFGEWAYAAEELIAEMGAAYLCAHCRLDGELRHASYLDSWLKVLRSDKRAIFAAAAQAQRAADFVLRMANPVDDDAVAAVA